MVGADPFARWEFREDRIDLSRWLKAPRKGYHVDVDLVRGWVVLKVHRQAVRREPYSGLRQIVWKGPRVEMWRSLTPQELESAGLAWRPLVARSLRECRRALRLSGRPDKT